MTNIELYTMYTETKERVRLLQEQASSIGLQLHEAETSLNELSAQVRLISDNALLDSLQT